MSTLAQHLLEQRIEDADQQIAHLKLRVEHQVAHLDELVQHPHESKKARATLDRWLRELSLLQHQRLNLYRQAVASGLRSKAS
jgi:hypothetical protein